jgi:mannose-6-phosphate isomerase-like protein (cupin superfamily)
MQPLFVMPGEGRAVSPIGGDTSQYKAVGDQTAGTLLVLEQSVPPGHGPRRHVHQREDESFYIIDGQFGFVVGDRSFVAPAGSFVLGPRGIPHRFWNAGTTTGRFLLVISPAGLEHFFEEISRANAESPGDLVRQAEIAARYGIAFV